MVTKKVKLSSGKEIEIKSLTMPQRVEIDDDLSSFYFKLGVNMNDVNAINDAPPPLVVAYKAVKYSVGEMELTNNELIELFTEIHILSHLSDEQKKS